MDCFLIEPSQTVQYNLGQCAFMACLKKWPYLSLLEGCSFVTLEVNSFSDVHLLLNEVYYITHV